MDVDYTTKPVDALAKGYVPPRVACGVIRYSAPFKIDKDKFNPYKLDKPELPSIAGMAGYSPKNNYNPPPQRYGVAGVGVHSNPRYTAYSGYDVF